MTTPHHLSDLVRDIKRWGAELGFGAVGITDTGLHRDEARLLQWLREERHGEMGYMARHGVKRSRPEALVPGTLRVISARLDYLPPAAEAWGVLNDPSQAYISRYALGRDYHKLMRRRLAQLARRMEGVTGGCAWRAFSDSAPVLEKPLAHKAGLGWTGKHSNLLSRDAGSWFFLGEIYTDLPLPVDTPAQDHCGSCRRCIDACPTAAIIAPYRIDARLCISYLTIEHHGPIPVHLRAPMGNRIYGCDDCQLVCPWNRFARPTKEAGFHPRHGLDAADLVDLFGWDEGGFLQRMEGSAIRRIGHERWLRNIAVALGNAAPHNVPVEQALRGRMDHPSALVREHVAWALGRI